MKNDIKITLMRPDQVLPVRNLLCQAFNMSAQRVDDEIGLAANRPLHPVLVAVDKETVIGAVQCNAFPGHDSWFNISGLVVADDYRRQGIGHALMQRAEDYIARNWIKGHTCTVGLSDETKKKNPDSRFYENMGYEPEIPSRVDNGAPVLQKTLLKLNLSNNQPRRQS